MSEPVHTPKTLLEPRPGRIGNFRSSSAHFLSALILFLCTAPFVDEVKYGHVLDIGFATLVFVTGVLAVGRSHRTLVLALMLMVPPVSARWLVHWLPDVIPAAIPPLTGLIFLCFLEWQLLHFIFRAPRVNSDVLCAGVSGYLLLGILWTTAYMLVSRLNPADATHVGAFAFTVGNTAPHALSQFEAYYFSFITLSTVGYGDITPLSHSARTLAMLEAMTGTLYMAVLISRLVALYSTEKPEADSKSN